jgi:hypothetical protein
MGDYGEKLQQTLLLLPQDIKISKRFNVRLFRTDEPTKAELARVAHLAASLEHSGQLDDLIITPDYYLIAGHRRRQAALLINERRNSNFQPLFRLRCRVDNSGGDLRLKAIASNLHRSDQSPMDLCYTLHTIRQEMGWIGRSNTHKLAAYVSMDDSTVNTLESLMRLETELQNMLHEGVISIKTCLDLRRAIPAPTDRAQVMARAATIQEEDILDTTLTAFTNGHKSLEETTRALQSGPRIRIQHPSVMKAIREKVGEVKTPLNRLELIASIAQFDTPHYSSNLREFARYWTKEFALGKGTQDELIARADLID